MNAGIGSSSPSMRTIDIVIPVFNGLDVARRCLSSVIATRTSAAFEVVVVDDASSDVQTATYLDQLAAGGAIRLLRNRTNQGFVVSANLGLALNPGRDVVLLNSDTEVANDWVARMQACAYSAGDVGTVTPFSNNATICSYPFEGWNGGVPGTLGLVGLDRLCADTSAGSFVELPTAVGFCMYIRRDCLDAVGLFDAESFGKGYGEENDFCLRASAVGWRHLLAGNVYVFHQGGASFSEKRHGLQQSAMQALLGKYPDYLEKIVAFNTRDPVAPLRRRLDDARLQMSAAERSHVLREQLVTKRELSRGELDVRPVQLHLSHSWGGGTDRWIRDFCRADGNRRNLVLRSRSERNHGGRWLELLEPARGETPLLYRELNEPINSTAIGHTEYMAMLSGIVAMFNVRSLVISSLIGHALEALETDLPTIVVLHDVYPFCPALFAYFDAPCEACSNDGLDSCLRGNPRNVFWHNTNASDWLALRAAYAERVGKPRIAIVAPTLSVWNRWTRLLPAIRHKPCRRIEHGIDLGAPRPRAEDIGHDRRLRFVVPGKLLPHKGLRLLHAVIESLLEHGDVLLLGSGEFGGTFTHMPGVQVIEHYDLADLAAAIDSFEPDLALLLSELPESFSYTLSEMWALGIPVVATRLGAFAERIEDGLTGFLVSPTPEDLMNCIRRLSANRELIHACRQNIVTRPTRDVSAMLADYDTILPPPSSEPRTLVDRCLSDIIGNTARQGQALAQAEGELNLLRAQAATLATELAARSRECEQMRESRSWAITSPLRALNRRLRQWRARAWQPSDTHDPVTREVVPETGAARPVSIIPASRAAAGEAGQLRQQLRHAMGVPDASSIVLIPNELSARLRQRFATLARDCVGSRNDVIFLLVQENLERGAWGSDWEEIALMASTRRLFIGNFGLVPGEIRKAADVVLEPGEGDWDRQSVMACLAPFGD